jgi:hypothetical protein
VERVGADPFIRPPPKNMFIYIEAGFWIHIYLIHIQAFSGTPTKRQISKRQVSKRLVSKRPVSKR